MGLLVCHQGLQAVQLAAAVLPMSSEESFVPCLLEEGTKRKRRGVVISCMQLSIHYINARTSLDIGENIDKIHIQLLSENV